MQHFNSPPECNPSPPMFWTAAQAAEFKPSCDYKKLVEMYGGFDIVHKILREASVGRVSDDTLDEMDTALGRYAQESLENPQILTIPGEEHAIKSYGADLGYGSLLPV